MRLGSVSSTALIASVSRLGLSAVVHSRRKRVVACQASRTRRRPSPWPPPLEIGNPSYETSPVLATVFSRPTACGPPDANHAPRPRLWHQQLHDRVPTSLCPLPHVLILAYLACCEDERDGCQSDCRRQAPEVHFAVQRISTQPAPTRTRSLPRLGLTWRGLVSAAV